ncbi:unnamed protein product, partial [Protopolystoma xenopodis]
MQLPVLHQRQFKGKKKVSSVCIRSERDLKRKLKVKPNVCKTTRFDGKASDTHFPAKCKSPQHALPPKTARDPAILNLVKMCCFSSGRLSRGGHKSESESRGNWQHQSRFPVCLASAEPE